MIDFKSKGVKLGIIAAVSIIALYLTIGSINRNKKEKVDSYIEPIVKDMYESNPGRLGEVLEKYKPYFTKKGFTSIDGVDNISNIVDRYSIYSRKENKVNIQKVMYGKDEVWIKFSITDIENNKVERLGIFDKHGGKLTNYVEYDIRDMSGK